MMSKEDVKYLADKFFKEQTLLFLKKNKDYGDSFTKSIQKFGKVSAFVRMDDKVNRFLQLTETGVIEVEDERIEDTLLDLLNYVVMYRAYQRNKVITLVDYLECLKQEITAFYVGSRKESYLHHVLTTELSYDESVYDRIFPTLKIAIQSKK